MQSTGRILITVLSLLQAMLETTRFSDVMFFSSSDTHVTFWVSKLVWTGIRSPVPEGRDKENLYNKISLTVRNEKIVLLYFSTYPENVKENKESPNIMVPMKANRYSLAIQWELKLPEKEWLSKPVLTQNNSMCWYFDIFWNLITVHWKLIFYHSKWGWSFTLINKLLPFGRNRNINLRAEVTWTVSYVLFLGFFCADPI